MKTKFEYIFDVKIYKPFFLDKFLHKNVTKILQSNKSLLTQK